MYSPYVVYLTKYSHYEQTYLNQQLSTLECNKEDLRDSVQSLGQSIPRAISIVTEANKRCHKFTEGCGFSGLMKAIKVLELGHSKENSGSQK